MNTQQLQNFINNTWDNSILPTLQDYIRIPNKSPEFDPKWRENGYMHKAAALLSQWAKSQALQGMQLEILETEDRTPLIYIDIPGTKNGNILLYGHLDKQPEMVGWDADLGPWKPVIRDEKLYGRGGADDGYAIFAAVSAIRALQQQNIPHPRCVILIEACEESGSQDLPFYIDHLKEKLGVPDLVICLDSGCGNYDQLWSTTSLRGLIAGNLHIAVLTEGIHSGAGGGAVPTTMLVLRQLLARLEDQTTGTILVPELQVKIPSQRISEAQQAAKIFQDQTDATFPFVKDTRPLTNEPAELILNRTWRAALSIIGMDDMPPIANAGNVLLPKLTAKLSFRLPPTCDIEQAQKAVQKILETDPPFSAHVKYEFDHGGEGWNAPELTPQLAKIINDASMEFFGKPAAYMGEGGSIPFMGMLGKKFPQAQFLITGVLGPFSNAHGPNEFLHIPVAKKLTASIAKVISEV